MIVDLERNDLGRVCRTGSVAVERLASCERVRHRPPPGLDRRAARSAPASAPATLLRATFPSGSITGAPKIRAMEIIDELERTPRGFYTGALGWIDASGDCDLNVAIRTAVARRRAARLPRRRRHRRRLARRSASTTRCYLKAAAFFRALGARAIAPRLPTLAAPRDAPPRERARRRRAAISSCS